MQTQRNEKQWGILFKRCIIIFCVFSLFLGVGTVFFLTSTIYAHNAHLVQPADMSPTAIPTAPTVIPTVPTAVPSPVPTTQPTPVPTTPPTPQPTAPKPNPTPAPPIPTATAIAGGPPVGNNPATQPTTAATSSPSPTAHKTATPTAASSATAVATTSTSSVIPGTNTTSTPSQQDANNAISIPQIVSIGGGAVLLAVVLFVGLVWRQRRMQQHIGQASPLQRSGLYPPQGRTMTEPLYQAPQPLMPQTAPEMVLATSVPGTPPMSYPQPTPAGGSMLREQASVYQEASPAPIAMMPPAEVPSQTSVPTADELLEAMMRQAQLGLFALPDKSE